MSLRCSTFHHPVRCCVADVFEEDNAISESVINWMEIPLSDKIIISMDLEVLNHVSSAIWGWWTQSNSHHLCWDLRFVLPIIYPNFRRVQSPGGSPAHLGHEHLPRVQGHRGRGQQRWPDVGILAKTFFLGCVSTDRLCNIWKLYVYIYLIIYIIIYIYIIKYI